ncbi:hypothetical protein [Streptomyces sp. NPDC026659]
MPFRRGELGGGSGSRWPFIEPYLLAMAFSGPGTNGSQVLLTVGEST